MNQQQHIRFQYFENEQLTGAELQIEKWCTLAFWNQLSYLAPGAGGTSRSEKYRLFAVPQWLKPSVVLQRMHHPVATVSMSLRRIQQPFRQHQQHS